MSHERCMQSLIERMDKAPDAGGLSVETGNSVWVQYMRFHQRTAQTSQEAQNKCRRIFMQVLCWISVLPAVLILHILQKNLARRDRQSCTPLWGVVPLQACVAVISLLASVIC